MCVTRHQKKGGDQLAQVKKNRNGFHVPGFVMLESIFAMITIMICFGICMMVFSTITSGSSTALQVNARIQLQSEADRCKSTHDFSDGITTEEQFVIEKTFTESNSGNGLIEMTLLAKNQDGKLLAEYHELLLR